MSTPPPPTDPTTSTPSVPPPSPTTAAASASPTAPASSAQTTATADLAATLAAPPPLSATVIKGVVQSVALTGTPPTISVTLQGDTTSTVAAVRFIDSYSPVTGDTVLLIKQGSDIFALGQMNDSNAGISNGWQTPSLGTNVTTNGNTNGPVQFRILVDNGDNKIQLKGSVAIAAGATALWTMPAGYAPTTKRTVTVARDVQGNLLSAQVDFNTDGTVVLVGGVTVPTIPSSGSGLTDSIAGTTSTSVVTVSGSSGTAVVSIGGTTTSVDPIDNTTSDQAGSVANSTHSHGVVGSHSHGYNNSEGGHSHSESLSEGGHSHTEASHAHTAPNHTHTLTVTAPVWISFNNVQFFT